MELRREDSPALLFDVLTICVVVLLIPVLILTISFPSFYTANRQDLQ